MWETRVQPLAREDPLGKEMTAHSSILSWRAPWTEESGELQAVGSQRGGHNWSDLARDAQGKIRIPLHRIEWTRWAAGVPLFHVLLRKRVPTCLGRCWKSRGLSVRMSKNRARTQRTRRILMCLSTGLEWKGRISPRSPHLVPRVHGCSWNPHWQKSTQILRQRIDLNMVQSSWAPRLRMVKRQTLLIRLQSLCRPAVLTRYHRRERTHQVHRRWNAKGRNHLKIYICRYTVMLAIQIVDVHSKYLSPLYYNWI